MVKNQHAAPHSKGGQQVKGEGNSRATVRTSTKKRSCQNCPRDFSKTNVPNREQRFTRAGLLPVKRLTAPGGMPYRIPPSILSEDY